MWFFTSWFVERTNGPIFYFLILTLTLYSLLLLLQVKNAACISYIYMTAHSQAPNFEGVTFSIHIGHDRE